MLLVLFGVDDSCYFVDFILGFDVCLLCFRFWMYCFELFCLMLCVLWIISWVDFGCLIFSIRVWYVDYLFAIIAIVLAFGG